MGYYNPDTKRYVVKYPHTARLRNEEPYEPEIALLIAEIRHRIKVIQDSVCDDCHNELKEDFDKLIKLFKKGK